MSFEVPEHVRPIRERVRRFIEERIVPVESLLDDSLGLGHRDQGRSVLNHRFQTAVRRG